MATFNKLLYPPTQNGLQKTIGSTLVAGFTTSITLNNTTGVQNKPGVIVVNRVDSNGDLKESSDREYIYYTGTSGSTLTGTLTRGLSGSSDQEHQVGSVVEFVPDVNVFEELNSAVAIIVDATDTTSINTTNIVTPTGTQTLTNKTVTGAVSKPGVSTITGGSPDMDLNTTNQFTLTLSEAATLTVSNETVGQCFMLEVIQDSGGSSYAVTWPSTVHWVSGTAPTLTTTADAVDMFGFRVTATDTYQGFVMGQDMKTA